MLTAHQLGRPRRRFLGASDVSKNSHRASWRGLFPTLSLPQAPTPGMPPPVNVPAPTQSPGMSTTSYDPASVLAPATGGGGATTTTTPANTPTATQPVVDEISAGGTIPYVPPAPKKKWPWVVGGLAAAAAVGAAIFVRH